MQTCKNGVNVIALDNNHEAYYDKSVKKARQKELQSLGINTQITSICNREEIMQIFESSPISHVINLAAHVT